MKASLEILPVTPLIGAEVIGIDLSEPLTNHQKNAIHEAFLKHAVLFFRNQDISVEQQKDFGRSFGELHIHPARDRNGLEGHPEILYLNAGPHTSRVNGDEWHSDVSCDEEPPLGSILRLFEVPSNGGDTLFSSMYAAYDALSEAMKELLGKLCMTVALIILTERNELVFMILLRYFQLILIQLFARIQKPVARLYLLTKFLHNILSTYLRMRVGPFWIFYSNTSPNLISNAGLNGKKTPLHFGTIAVLYITQCGIIIQKLGEGTG